MPGFNSIGPGALLPIPLATSGGNVQVNNRATDPYPLITQNDVSLAVSGNTIVVGFNDDWYGPPPFSFMGWSVSIDGRRRCKDRGELPPAGVTAGGMGGDPLLYTDHLGDFYYGSLGTEADGTNIIAVRKSTNGGLDWSDPVDATPGEDPINFADKPEMAIDTFADSIYRGNIYLCYVDYLLGADQQYLTDVLRVSRSTDGGATRANVSASLGGAPVEEVQGCMLNVGPGRASLSRMVGCIQAAE